MSGKSQVPDKGQQPVAAKVAIERGDAKASAGKVAKARNGVADKTVADKIDARDVTNGALRDARIEYLNELPKRGVAVREE